jgi:hypothetical protein
VKKTSLVSAETAKLTLGFLLMCSSQLALLPTALAQASDTANLASAAGSDSSRVSSTSPRSMKVDVKMVLVPVTVTDAMDRPVLGLDKRNFALYQDSEPQEIRDGARGRLRVFQECERARRLFCGYVFEPPQARRRFDAVDCSHPG